MADITRERLLELAKNVGATSSVKDGDKMSSLQWFLSRGSSFEFTLEQLYAYAKSIETELSTPAVATHAEPVAWRWRSRVKLINPEQWCDWSNWAFSDSYEMLAGLKKHADAGNDFEVEVNPLFTASPVATQSQEKDAARYRFLRGEAYECVIPHGNKIKNKRTAWTIKLHVGENFNEAIDAAIAELQPTEGK